MLISRRIHVAAFFIMALCGASLASTNSVATAFVDLAPPALNATQSANDWIVPRRYRSLQLDHAAMRRTLQSAPSEVIGNPMRGSEIVLPMPDGTNQRFLYSESPIMEPALQAQFPDIRTYVGQGIDDPTATLRMDMTPAGFHAQILSASGSAYIDPRTRDLTIYASYFKRDAAKTADWTCGVTGNAATTSIDRDIVPLVALGTELRTYRLACAATAEYTAFHGGTVTGAMAAIVTAFNRVNGIYEREVAVRMNLVANNSSLVFLNAITDGYTNDDGGVMLGENQTKLDSVIGSANYDIGHVFSTGGGGIASLGSVCSVANKARGVTGSSSPINDPFYVDYVCHEVGHQFDANHTFNSETGLCGDGNKNNSTAFEVGSGSTILSYAGICSPNDVQPLSDDYFHAGSLSEISSFITDVSHSCPVKTSTGNSIPTVSAGSDYTIPRNTPFTLTASANDSNGDALTYCWEQMDLGPTADLGAADTGAGPLFRTYRPTTNNWRTFPALTNILANTTNLSERLPNTARTMNFRVTVRDNRAGGGANNSDLALVTVATNAGPFLITNLNTSGTFSGLVTVGWSVAGTTNAPVSAAQVKIMLSTNGGLTFPITLTPNTPNTGSASVLLPNITNNNARIMVQGVNNIFFDINDANLSIRPTSLGTALVQLASTILVSENCAPTNGALDPGETVSMRFVLGNYGNRAASNITATLMATNGVLLPGPTVAYGTIQPGGFATQTIAFTVGGTCGGNITPTLRIDSGTNSLGLFSSNLGLGAIATVSRSTTNNSSITIRDNTTAVPYPSTITVTNMPATPSKVTATLRTINHSYSGDIDIILVGPSGVAVALMTSVGSSAINATITFDDDADDVVPTSGSIATGTYRPLKLSSASMPSPAPAAPYGTSLSSFNGINANGTWQLYLRDNASGDTGTISNGWSIGFEMESVVCCDAVSAPPLIQAFSAPEASPLLALNGAGGVPFGTNYLFATTNLMIPPTNWSRIGTNISDVNGFFGFTNVPDPMRPQHFYMIQTPP